MSSRLGLTSQNAQLLCCSHKTPLSVRVEALDGGFPINQTSEHLEGAVALFLRATGSRVAHLHSGPDVPEVQRILIATNPPHRHVQFADDEVPRSGLSKFLGGLDRHALSMGRLLQLSLVTDFAIRVEGFVNEEMRELLRSLPQLRLLVGFGRRHDLHLRLFVQHFLDLSFTFRFCLSPRLSLRVARWAGTGRKHALSFGQPGKLGASGDWLTKGVTWDKIRDVASHTKTHHFPPRLRDQVRDPLVGPHEAELLHHASHAKRKNGRRLRHHPCFDHLIQLLHRHPSLLSSRGQTVGRVEGNGLGSTVYDLWISRDHITRYQVMTTSRVNDPLLHFDDR